MNTDQSMDEGHSQSNTYSNVFRSRLDADDSRDNMNKCMMMSELEIGLEDSKIEHKYQGK